MAPDDHLLHLYGCLTEPAGWCGDVFQESKTTESVEQVNKLVHLPFERNRASSRHAITVGMVHQVSLKFASEKFEYTVVVAYNCVAYNCRSPIIVFFPVPVPLPYVLCVIEIAYNCVFYNCKIACNCILFVPLTQKISYNCIFLMKLVLKENF